MFLILIMRFYTSAAAHDYSRMSTVRGEEADQSHPQNAQQRMLKIKGSIRKKKQRILANFSNEVTRKMTKMKATTKKKKTGQKKVRA
jgi:hypothetical protein